MWKIGLTFLLYFFVSVSLIWTQEQTVGLFQLQEGTFEGYTLFSPSASTNVYLIDNCGEMVHAWECSTKPGNATYLMPDGSLFRAGQLNNLKIHAGGAGGLIEQYSWDNQLLWQFTYNTTTVRAHHDFQVLPNGNILILAWEVKDQEEAIQSGRRPELLADDKLWPEHIVEIQPIGTDSAVIVWEWHVWDHLIQDFDPSKQNFGKVGDHPGKIDINYTRPERYGADWLHANSIHYHPGLDQILLSVLYFDEIWIIDHNTTTVEAAGDQGDLLYRWGNPQTYHRVDSHDQKLYGQHDARWIEEGLPDAGKIMIFNNGQGRPDSLYSSIIKIQPNYEDGAYGVNENGLFLPTQEDWSYTADPPSSFYASFVSGAQQLPNGNLLINDGAHGTFFELNDQNQQLWKYVNPVTIFGIAAQGALVVNPAGNGTNSVFRATKYPKSYPAFIAKDLKPKGIIEDDPNRSPCLVPSTKEEQEEDMPFALYPNPVHDKLHIRTFTGTYELFNMQGQRIRSGFVEQEAVLRVEALASGIYLLLLSDGGTHKIIVQH